MQRRRRPRGNDGERHSPASLDPATGYIPGPFDIISMSSPHRIYAHMCTPSGRILRLVEQVQSGIGAITVVAEMQSWPVNLTDGSSSTN